MLDRRSLLTGGLLALATPAICRAGSLMPISLRALPPRLWGDGVHDDTKALQWLLNEEPSVMLPPGVYRLTDTVTMPDGAILIGVGDAAELRIDHSKIGFEAKGNGPSFISGVFLNRVMRYPTLSPADA